MTYPMPPVLLEQIGLEPCADTDPQWPEDHDELGWGRRVAPTRALDEPARRDQVANEEERDGRCVAELYDELAPRLRSIVCRDVNASAAAIEEACQFAWYRLIRHAHRIERKGALSWLARTAVHEAIKIARRDQRELSLEARADEDGELNIASPVPGPHEQAVWRERLAEVSQLPLRQQRFLWRFAAGCSYEEIAAQHAGLTKRTVERQIHHGRRRLKAAA